MTLQDLINQINNKEAELRKLNSKLQSHVGTYFIEQVYKHLQLCPLELRDNAELLADELNERDEPLDYKTIKSIFDFSGFEYNESHIEMARPDSQECINEQLRYYQD